jgi:hypothetical protein
MKNYNMNARAEVKLTPYGRKVYRKYISQYRDIEVDPEKSLEIYKIDKLIENQGVLKSQLWEIARIFGPVLYNGNPEVPFVNNEIRIEEE